MADSSKLNLTYMVERAIDLLINDEDRTLTLVVPTDSYLTQPGTFLRTEQRKWFSKALPYLHGIVDLKGPIYSRAWNLGGGGGYNIGQPEVSHRKWMVLCLKGPKQAITESHRSAIQIKEFNVTHELVASDMPSIVSVVSEPKIEVYLEASRNEWTWNDRGALLDVLKGEIPVLSKYALEDETDKATNLEWYESGYPTRNDACRWAAMVPEAVARAVVKSQKICRMRKE